MVTLWRVLLVQLLSDDSCRAHVHNVHRAGHKSDILKQRWVIKTKTISTYGGYGEGFIQIIYQGSKLETLIFIHFHSFSFIFIHFHSFSFIFIHFHTFSFIFIHFYSFLFIFIHFYSFLFIFIHFHSFSFIFIHFHSFSFIFIHFHSFSFILIHFQRKGDVASK